MSNNVKELLETIIKTKQQQQQQQKGNIRKDVIKNLVRMSDKELLDYVQKMGSVPLDDQGRQIISCPTYPCAACHLHTIYEDGSATTVCTGPVVGHWEKRGFFGGVKDSYYGSGQAHRDCQYNPQNKLAEKEVDDVIDQL